jgi:Tfp pilus assembly protein PilF
MLEKESPVDSSESTTVLNNMGLIEFAEGRFKEAAVLHEKALAKRSTYSISHIFIGYL